MKKLIALAVVLTATVAQAEELKFGDANYFFKQNQVNLSANFLNVRDTQSIDGTRTSIRGWHNDLTATFGLLDDVNIFANVGYNYDVEVTTNGVSREFNQDGATNPAIGGIKRILNQNDGDFNVDLGASYRFSFEDEQRGALAGGREKEGNAALGRNALEVFARVGNKWNEANEWQFIGGLVYNQAGDHMQYDLATGANQEWDDESSFDMYARAVYQYRPVNEFMINLTLQGTRVGETTSTIRNTDVEQDAHLDLELKFTAKYLVLNNLIVRVVLGESNRQAYDYKVTGDRKSVV